MRSSPRWFSRVAACALAALAVGCASKNKDTIVGKWVTAGEGEGSTPVVFELTEDGQFSVESKASGPNAAEPPQRMSGRYTLRSGNWVDMEIDSPEENRTRDRDWIEIEGDTMTVKDGNQTRTFTRMK